VLASKQKVLILGLGRSGFASANLAARLGAEVFVVDTRIDDNLTEKAESLKHRGVKVYLEWNSTKWEQDIDFAIQSPGIHPQSILGKLANKLPCKVISELEYGYQYCACPIIAVTGTNGKTTTVEIITSCLKKLGKNVMAAGNIGLPLCEAAMKSSELDLLIVEVSSFQLEKIEHFTPLAAAVLNVSEDHLDRYDDFEQYFKAKFKIFKNMKSANIVLRSDLLASQLVRDILNRQKQSYLLFSSKDILEDGFFVDNEGWLCQKIDNKKIRLMHSTKLKLKGMHNVENVLAAMALCFCANIDPQTLVSGLEMFIPSPHRLDMVALHNGVCYVNDSKATNSDAVKRAINTVSGNITGKILLIAGGLDKNINFQSLAPLLKKNVKKVFLIGQSRKKMAEQWQDVVYCKQHASLAAAVDAAVDNAQSGDAVLLSPGCASQDMFVDYVHRGRKFCELVKKSIGE